MENNHHDATTSSTNHKDYYKVLGVDYDATDEDIRFNYRKLALKWHPDKHRGDSAATANFQQINEAYRAEVILETSTLFSRDRVLSDPTTRLEYDLSGNYEIDNYTLREYLARFKGLILTCNGLGINHNSFWTQHLKEGSK